MRDHATKKFVYMNYILAIMFPKGVDYMFVNMST
jgi:hypothetical protein